MAITPSEFEHAKQAAQQLLYAGNKLIETAVRGPITNSRGNTTHTLTAEILDLRRLLIEAGPRVNAVLPYLQAVVDEPVEHAGIIATTVHSLAHAFADRLCLAVANVLQAHRYASGIESGNIWEQAALWEHQDEIRERLRQYQQIDAYRLSQRIEIESAKARALVKQDQDQRVETGPPETPKTYLWNWTEILDAVGMPDAEENRRQIRRLSDMHNGPITVPAAGGRPVADRAKLLVWWDGLESRFQELQQRRQDQQATVADQYSYGRTGVVVPGIDGSEKKRRSTKKK